MPQYSIERLSDLPSSAFWWDGESVVIHTDTLLKSLPVNSYDSIVDTPTSTLGHDWIPIKNIDAFIANNCPKGSFMLLRKDIAIMAERFRLKEDGLYLFSDGHRIKLTDWPSMSSHIVHFDSFTWDHPDTMAGQNEIHGFFRDLEIAFRPGMMTRFGRDEGIEKYPMMWRVNIFSSAPFIAARNVLNEITANYHERRRLRAVLMKL